jgi:nodulation protein E
MNPARVVISGIGVISALGNNHREYWTRLTSGDCGISKIQQTDCSDMRFNLGAEVKNYSSEAHFTAKQINWLDRFAQFALLSADEAIKDAGLSQETITNTTTAVITGSCLGGQNTEDSAFLRFYQQNNKRSNPNVIPNVMANAGASHIAATYGITGPAYTVSTACSSSTHAIGQAYWLIRNGVVERAIAGGSEAPFSSGHLRAWEALRVVSPSACRPFSKGRNGMVLGEGGAMMILETLSSAEKRGAPIYAEIIGFGMSADATHLTDPNTRGQQRAIEAAFNDARITAETVNYINAHGTGTLANDQIESSTIRTLFPHAKEHLRVSSTKGAHGHLLGATGAIEAISTVLALKHQLIPPTINFLEPDEECNIPLVVNSSQPQALNCAMSSSFAFGGLNAILLFKTYT